MTEVEWSATGDRAGMPPPVLGLRITPATHTETTEIALSVYQECVQSDYLWGGQAPDRPTVDLTVTPSTLPPLSPTSREASPSPTQTPTRGPSPAPAVAMPSDNDSSDGAGWVLLVAGSLGLAAIGVVMWLRSKRA